MLFLIIFFLTNTNRSCIWMPAIQLSLTTVVRVVHDYFSLWAVGFNYICSRFGERKRPPNLNRHNGSQMAKPWIASFVFPACHTMDLFSMLDASPGCQKSFSFHSICVGLRKHANVLRIRAKADGLWADEACSKTLLSYKGLDCPAAPTSNQLTSRDGDPFPGMHSDLIFLPLW